MDIEVESEQELWTVYTLTKCQNMTPESISEQLAHDIPPEDIEQSLKSLQDRGVVENQDGWQLQQTN